MVTVEGSWARLWDKTDAVAIHTQKGIDFYEKYATFVKERAAIEEEYATKLKNLSKKNIAKRKDEDKSFTYLNMFYKMLEELDSLAGQHEVIAEKLKKEIHQDIIGKAGQLKQLRKGHLIELQNLNTNLTKSVEIMEKANKNYHKTFKDAEAAHIKYLKNDKNMDLSRAEVEKSKNTAIVKSRLCEEAKQAYACALQQANELKREHYGAKLPSLLQTMRETDIERINATKIAMKNTIDAEIGVMSIIQRCYDGMTKAVMNINPESDTQIVVEQNATGYPIPDDFEFIDLQDPARSINSDNMSDSSSLKKGFSNQKNGKLINRKPSMHEKLFGNNEKKIKNGNHSEYGNLPPQQRCRKIQNKLDELKNEEDKLQNSLTGVEKMLEVYTSNPKMGNPKDLEPEAVQYRDKLKRVRDESSKYKTLLEQIQAEMKNTNLGNSDSLKYYNNSSTASSPRITSSGVSSASNTNRTSYSEESVSSEGSSGFTNKKNVQSTPVITNGHAKPVSTPVIPQVPIMHQKETNGNYEEFEMPILGTCKAMYSYDGSSDGTTVAMKEGDEMLLLERDEGDGWTRIRHLRTKLEGFVPTSYLNCQWYN